MKFYLNLLVFLLTFLVNCVIFTVELSKLQCSQSVYGELPGSISNPVMKIPIVQQGFGEQVDGNYMELMTAILGQ